MKRRNLYLFIATALVPLSLLSCNVGDDHYRQNDYYPNAMVTVKSAEDGSLYLQLDDETTLRPANLTKSPFGDKEVRAFINFRRVAEESGEYDEAVHVNWIDSILTKKTVPFVEGQNDELYGSAPVEIMDDWITIVEDGYLTLHLLMGWCDPSIKHRINLVTGVNPDDPYEVELRHDSQGDAGGKVSSAYVAFRLDGLPDTNGETVKLRLKWKSSRGDRSAEFDYRTRTDEFQLQTGDLLFQEGRDGGMNDAIAQATGDELDFDYTHVGIAIVGPDGPQVIEATGGVGVVITALDEFLARSAMSDDGPVVVAARLISPRREQISLQAIERAKTFLGQPYDTSFLPDNGKIYCSELVWESFLDDGVEIFDAQPMNFRAPDGTMPPYWTAHFAALGEPIPEGVPGTNPHDMSHDEDIKIIHRY